MKTPGFIFIAMLLFCSCRHKSTEAALQTPDSTTAVYDTIAPIHKRPLLTAELDGDKKTDSIFYMQDSLTRKYGLKIMYGSGNVHYIGMGKDQSGLDIDDLNWAGVFEIYPKGSIYFNNVNEEGDIIDESEVEEKDKIRLPNDGIFLHQWDACGGGIIYLYKGKYYWIQQE